MYIIPAAAYSPVFVTPGHLQLQAWEEYFYIFILLLEGKCPQHTQGMSEKSRIEMRMTYDKVYIRQRWYGQRITHVASNNSTVMYE